MNVSDIDKRERERESTKGSACEGDTEETKRNMFIVDTHLYVYLFMRRFFDKW